GVNLGLLDAAALIETLAQERASGASAEALGEKRALRRYERWRKSENTLAVGLIDGLNRLFSGSRGLNAPLRRWGLNAVDRLPLIKDFLMSRALGTGGELPQLAQSRRS